MKKIYVGLLVVITSLLMVSYGQAQSLEERVKKFGEDFTRGYCGPFVDAFGASLNSGWYHSANVEDGLDLFIGVKAMLMPVPDDSKTFMIASPVNGTMQTIPTLFGEKTEVPISGAPAGNNYPAGLDLKWTPMIVPHFSIGNIFGTRLMIRWLPTINIPDYGDFTFFGLGVQHGLNQYIPMLPLDISAMIAFQSLSVGNLITAKAFTFGAQSSVKLSILTLYGGLAYESSSMSFAYNAEILTPAGTRIPTKVGFDVSGKNNVRATVGFALSLAILKINADYSLASQPVATVGLGLGW